MTNAASSSSLATSASALSLRPAVLYPWFAPVTTLKGVGPSVLQGLRRLLANSHMLEEHPHHTPALRDLLFHLPIGVIDRRNMTAVSALKKSEYATVEVTVTEHAPPPPNRPRVPYKVATEDATGTLMLTFFHVKGDYLSHQLPVGEKRIICGVMEWYNGMATMAHPDVIAAPEKASEVIRLSPVYALTLGISQKTVAKATTQVVEKMAPLAEWHSSELLKEKSWPSFTGALKALHMPNEAADILADSAPRARLAYDELLANQLALGLLRRIERRQQSFTIPHNEAVIQLLMKVLPFSLTKGQEQVLADILKDITSGERMVRLLQGDVGSGKTVLAFAAMAQAAAAGLQSAFMAPTDLLARQHLETLQPLAEALKIPLALLSGKMRKGEREDIQAALAVGEIKIAVGTHALFQDDVKFFKLGLVVVDEQHRFGVAQRMKLTGKGRTPHLLQMTATPIPRSLTMTMVGDMDISALTERPPGRKEIDTRAIPFARIKEVIEGLGRVLNAGEKIYWVCPIIEENTEDDGKLDLAAAEERYAQLSKIFPKKVGIIHGRMKLAERERVMQDFACGDLQLLVATTVVEVGVNVTSATVMVVEHAERFGLAQLHQLRGRVGRSNKASRCILLYHDPLTEVARRRLTTLRETNDGFVIAEEDLKLRGAGDVLGTRQTGLPEFKLADMSQHLGLIRLAHDDARHILSTDPELLSPRGRALRLLLALFEYDVAMGQLKPV